MPRYKLLIEYNGAAYSGWQKQPNAKTVEEEIEKALSKILQSSIDIIGQGRTDRGVHAEAQVAHFDPPHKINENDLLYALLGELPRDIAVWKIVRVKDDFHARFDAVLRRYRYQIVSRPSPLLYNTALLVRDEINWEGVRKCAQMIEGTHDFESFSKPNADRRNERCTVTLSEITIKDTKVCYRIEANRFVHHMVRRLVGSMLQVGKGKWPEQKFENLLKHPKSASKGQGVAAKGLILEEVKY